MRQASGGPMVETFSWTAVSTTFKVISKVLVHKLIAIRFGPEGFGKSNNMSSFASYLDNLSGGGIFNGINKHVAQFHDDRSKQQRVVGTASAIVLSASLLLAVVFLFFEDTVNKLVCLPTDSLWLIRAASVAQFVIALSNLLRAVLKGRGDAVGNSLSVIVGSSLGLLVFWLGLHYYGYGGMLTGLMLMPAWTLVPAVVLFYRHAPIPWRWLVKLSWDPQVAISLFKFGLMALLTTGLDMIICTTLRNWLKAYDGWIAVGLWQGVHKFSEIYFQITTSFLSVYLLPLLSKQKRRADISQAMQRTLRFIFPIAILVSGLFWLLREKLTLLLFSEKFKAMNELYVWHLSGDVFKIANATFTSLILSKALLGFHLLSGFWLLFSILLFSYLLIPRRGAIGVAQAHLVAHLLYFIAAAATCLHYARINSNKKDRGSAQKIRTSR